MTIGPGLLQGFASSLGEVVGTQRLATAVAQLFVRISTFLKVGLLTVKVIPEVG